MRTNYPHYALDYIDVTYTLLFSKVSIIIIASPMAQKIKFCILKWNILCSPGNGTVGRGQGHGFKNRRTILAVSGSTAFCMCRTTINDAQ